LDVAVESPSLAIATIALPTPEVPVVTTPTLIPRAPSFAPPVASCEKAFDIVAFAACNLFEFPLEVS